MCNANMHYTSMLIYSYLRLGLNQDFCAVAINVKCMCVSVFC